MISPLTWQTEPVRVLAEAIRNNRSALDASDTGTGKTYQALFACKEEGRRVAVVCPKSVIPAWEEAVQAVGVRAAFIQNIEALKAEQLWIKGNGKKWRWVVDPVEPVVTIIDECHRFSGSDTENGAILAAAPKPVLMLSATAAPDPTKMRGIAHQLGLCRWNDWWQWCGRNGCKRGHFGGLQFKGGQEHLDRLHRQIFTTGLGVRVRIADLGSAFPDCTIETISVPVEDQKAIDEAYAKELEALEADAPNAAVEILRARQISEHQKLAAAIELVSDTVASGHSVAVFVNFRDSLQRLVAEFGCPAIYGGQDPEERQAGIDSFQSKKARVIAAMIQAGGEAINLQDVIGNRPTTSFIFLGWSAREGIQAKGRTHRANGKTPVFIKFVFAEGTVEQRIRAKVNQKLTNIETLNDGDLTMKHEPNKQSTSQTAHTGTSTSQPSTQIHTSEQGVSGQDGTAPNAVDRPGNPQPPVQGKNDCVVTVVDLNEQIRKGGELLEQAAAAHAERAHANISPSKLKNLELSPMFVQDKTQAEHPFTARGTRCHEALENCDDSKLQDPEEREWVGKCRDWMEGYSDWEKHTELRLEMGGDIYGFADVVYKKGWTAVLVDFKFSQSLQEDCETNPAAQAYVLGVFNKWPEVDTVEVFYLYPIRDEVSHAVYNRQDDYSRILLRLATIKARVEEATSCTPHYETCLYCGRKATCRDLHKMALPIATRYQETHQDLQIPEQYDPSLITDPVTMAKAKVVASVLSKWCESVDFHALRLRQETGVEIPGFDLRSRQGKAKILNPLIAHEIALKNGITTQQFLAAADVSAKQLKDAAAENAKRGGKQKAAQRLEDALRDSGVLELDGEVFFLAKTKH